MSGILGQLTPFEANKNLQDARGYDTADIAKNAGTIAESVALQMSHTRSFMPALGQYLYFQGRPFHEGMAKMMQPAFKMDLSPMSLWKCGRQVGKSLTMSAKTILLTAAIPHFHTLTVTPLFEMTRRLSTNYVSPLIAESPIRTSLTGPGYSNNVLQKTFMNSSTMHFSFAFLDCTRIRGLAIDRVTIDEVQDIDADFIPIIAQTMGRSAYRIQDFSGTPKTFDNTVEILWRQSSRAEWVIPCSCGHTNDPNTEADGLKMIGLEGLVCAKCDRPLNSSAGSWYHHDTSDNKMVEFPGYHVPQFILPFHYESKRNWKIILDALSGGVAPHILYNEIFAESYDTGSKLVTETDLKRACKLQVNLKDYAAAKSRTSSYLFRVLGIDWGGRGATGISMTKIAVMGMCPDGRMDLIYGENMSTLIDEAAEVVRAIQIFNDFSCDMLAHDAGGSGGMRDVLLSTTRFPMQKVMPFVYVRAWANNPITFHPGTEIQPKAYYSLDKARSLALMANMIKSDWMRFTSWESCKDLVTDFLALVEEKNETKKAGDLYLITRSANSSDDFAHAVNFACMCAFHSQDRYPDLLKRVDQARFELNEQQVGALAPKPSQADWEAEELEDEDDGYEVL